MIIEIGVKTFPSFLFLILALVRFKEIRSIGFASRITVYSKLFLLKEVISYTLVFFYLTLIVIVFSLPDKGANDDICWFTIYSKQAASLVYLVNASAWLVSELLMRYEYRKRLSEAIYSH